MKKAFLAIFLVVLLTCSFFMQIGVGISRISKSVYLLGDYPHDPRGEITDVDIVWPTCYQGETQEIYVVFRNPTATTYHYLVVVNIFDSVHPETDPVYDSDVEGENIDEDVGGGQTVSFGPWWYTLPHDAATGTWHVLAGLRLYPWDPELDYRGLSWCEPEETFAVKPSYEDIFAHAGWEQDSDSDGYYDSIRIQVQARTNALEEVDVEAYGDLRDPYGNVVDNSGTGLWTVPAGGMSWSPSFYLFVPGGSPVGKYTVDLYLYDGTHRNDYPDPEHVIVSAQSYDPLYPPGYGVHRKLTVHSAHDSPVPGVGDNYYDDGESVTCSVTSPVTEGDTEWTCTGWSGTGSVPASGTGTSTGSFIIHQDSTITWNWQPSKYRLIIAVNPSSGGTTNPAVGTYWLNSGQSQTVSETQNTGYIFDHWDLDGSNVGTGSSYTVIMNTPHTLTAIFVAQGAPSLTLFDPAIDDLTVTVNGVTLPGTPGTTITRIHWDWGDGNSEDHWFPASHTYADYNDYTITVTSYQSDGLFTTKTKDISLHACMPDLIVEDVWWVPSLTGVAGTKPTAGQPFDIYFRIKNQGAADVTTTFATSIFADANRIGIVMEDFLGAGQTSTYCLSNINLTSGTHTILVYVDSSYAITESEEGNNDLSKICDVKKAKWTVLVYMDGDNADLESWIVSSFKQLSMLGSTENMSIVVQMDLYDGTNNPYGGWKDCKRFFVTKGMDPWPSNAIGTGMENMGDEQCLIDFLDWALNREHARFEADHYLLVLQDHGMSWVGCCKDQSSGQTLTLNDLEIALKNVIAVKKLIFPYEGDEKFDVVWFDCCLMSSIEVAYQVCSYADYFVGSETESWYEPDPWPYYTVLRYFKVSLEHDDYYSNYRLANEIVYQSDPVDDSTRRTQCVSSLNCSNVARLVASVDLLSNQLRNALPTERDEIKKAREACWWTVGPFGDQSEMIIDLYQFAWQLNDKVQNSEIKKLAQWVMGNITSSTPAHSVVMEKERSVAGSAWFCNGLSIYFPLKEDQCDTDYYRLESSPKFAKNTQWDEFLVEYYALKNNLRIIGECPVNLLVTDPNGLRVGYDPETGNVVNEIPAAFYSGPGTHPQEIMIPYPVNGSYIIKTFGTGTGSYIVTIASLIANVSTIDIQTWEGTTVPNETKTEIVYLTEDGELIMPIGCPNLAVFEPEINGPKVNVNGVVLPANPNTTITRIHWGWGDGKSEDHWFATTHTYGLNGEYIIAVTAYQSDGLHTTEIKHVQIQTTTPAHNLNTGVNYTTIQAAIDASETLDGHTIFVDEGTYYEHLVINKSILLIGKNVGTTIIDGNFTGTVISIAANNVTIREFTIRNSQLIYHPLAFGGIEIRDCGGAIIQDNDIVYNNVGIRLYNSSENRISGNNIMANHLHGIYFYGSERNIIYHNNFLNNTYHVNPRAQNIWDDGYPSGGNYWSDYAGVDVMKGPNQDQPGSDGIGDMPYAIDANNRDRYPLMYPYGSPPPPTYALTITTTANGTTDPATGTYLYSQGQSVPVQAIPDTYYSFDYWELDGTNAGSANPISVLMDSNHTLHAVFVQINYTLTITATAGGTTNPAPGVYTYTGGSNVQITAIPNINYTLDHWELDGVNRTENPINVIMDQDHTLHAVFMIHDIAVTNVTPSKTVVGQGYNMNINVTVANQGDYTETFNVTLYANTTAIATQTVTLTSGNSTTITFTWNTTDFVKGNYTISAYAWPVQGETDLADNTKDGGTVLVSIAGDVNGDHLVDISDLVITVNAIPSAPGWPNWNSNADINDDGACDISDLVICIGNIPSGPW